MTPFVLQWPSKPSGTATLGRFAQARLRFDEGLVQELQSYYDVRAVAESRFLGTRRHDAYVVEAVGAEGLEIVDGKIKEIHDDHTRVSPAVADSASMAEAVHSP